MAHRIAPRRLLATVRNLAAGVTLIAAALLGLGVAGTGPAAQAATDGAYFTLEVPGSGTVTFTEGRYVPPVTSGGELVRGAEFILSKKGTDGLNIVQSSKDENVSILVSTGSPGGPAVAEWNLLVAVPAITISSANPPVMTVTFRSNAMETVYQ